MVYYVLLIIYIRFLNKHCLTSVDYLQYVYKKYSIEEYYYEYDDDNNKTNNRFLPGLEETFFEIQNEEWVNISSCGICNS